MATTPLPSEIEDSIAACERMVDDDITAIDASLDSLSGIPADEFDVDEPSLVQHVEELRKTTQRARSISRSAPVPAASKPRP